MEHTNGTFYQASMEQFRRGLSTGAIATYSAIRSFAWASGGEVCTASVSTIRRMIGASDKSTRTYIQEIEDAGLITVDRSPGHSLRIHAPRDVEPSSS